MINTTLILAAVRLSLMYRKSGCLKWNTLAPVLIVQEEMEEYKIEDQNHCVNTFLVYCGMAGSAYEERLFMGFHCIWHRGIIN